MDHHGMAIVKQEVKENIYSNMSYYDKMEGLQLRPSLVKIMIIRNMSGMK